MRNILAKVRHVSTRLKKQSVKLNVNEQNQDRLKKEIKRLRHRQIELQKLHLLRQLQVNLPLLIRVVKNKTVQRRPVTLRMKMKMDQNKQKIRKVGITKTK